jgi:hypothetical protein
MTSTRAPLAWGSPTTYQMGLPDLGLIVCMLLMGSRHPTAALLGWLTTFGIFAVSGRALAALNTRLIVLLLCLLTTLCLHQLPLMYEGWTDFTLVIKLIVFGIMAYWCGAAHMANSQSMAQALAPAAALALGFSGFALAAAINSGFLVGGMLILQLYPTDPITGLTIHKTHMGMYSSLGICLLPVVLAFGPRRCGSPWLWVAMLLAAIMGLGANLATQNRTPLLALMMCFLGVWMLKTFSGPLRLSSMDTLARKLLFTLFTTAALACAIYLSADWLSDNLLLAFKKGALDTPRYKVWETMFLHFGDHFWGGRKIRLPEFFAHNFWLDALWDSGIPAFFAWLFLSIAHGVMLGSFLRTSAPLLMRAVVLCLSLSFFASMLAEPVASAAVTYLLALIFMMGLIANARSTQTQSAKSS